MKKILRNIFLGAALLVTLTAASCEDDATVASRNLSKAADNFEVVRNIVFYNTWTDTEVATITGLCSIEVETHKLAVICKDGSGDFKKHYLGRSANLSFLAVQVEGADVSTMHTRITWKPQGFIPNIDFRGDAGQLIDAVTPDDNDG